MLGDPPRLSPLRSAEFFTCLLGTRTHGALPMHRGPPGSSWRWPDASSLQVGPIEATTFTLRTARPQAKYCVQVSAQDLTDYGKPSDWSFPGRVEGAAPQSPEGWIRSVRP